MVPKIADSARMLLTLHQELRTANCELGLPSDLQFLLASKSLLPLFSRPPPPYTLSAPLAAYRPRNGHNFGSNEASLRKHLHPTAVMDDRLSHKGPDGIALTAAR